MYLLTPTFRNKSLTIFNADILAEGVIGFADVLFNGVVLADNRIFVLFLSISNFFGVKGSGGFPSIEVVFVSESFRSLNE